MGFLLALLLLLALFIAWIAAFIRLMHNSDKLCEDGKLNLPNLALYAGPLFLLSILLALLLGLMTALVNPGAGLAAFILALKLLLAITLFFVVLVLWDCIWENIKRLARDTRSAVKQAWNYIFDKPEDPGPLTPPGVAQACTSSIKTYPPIVITYTEFEADGWGGLTGSQVEAIALANAKGKAQFRVQNEINKIIRNHQCAGNCSKIPTQTITLTDGPYFRVERGNIYDAHRCTVTYTGNLKIECRP